ncbi:MAG TPA: hypothetical protein VGN42_02335 [Pirellulales bacterium]|nr:hypothetical protein [Pirellulales bacterium]
MRKEREQGLSAYLLHGITALIIFLGMAFRPVPTANADENGKNARRPNVVLIIADDKYEYRAHEAANLRENRQNTAFSAQSQIAGNCGEFRGIAGD